MKIRFGMTTEELEKHERFELSRMIRKQNWHRFFAIWPRKVADGDYRCFEWIERRYYCRRSCWYDVKGAKNLEQFDTGVEYRAAISAMTDGGKG